MESKEILEQIKSLREEMAAAEARLKIYIDEKFAVLDEKTKRRNSMLYGHGCEDCRSFFQCTALGEGSCSGCESFIDGSCDGLHKDFPYDRDLEWKGEIRTIHNKIDKLKECFEKG